MAAAAVQLGKRGSAEDNLVVKTWLPPTGYVYHYDDGYKRRYDFNFRCLLRGGLGGRGGSISENRLLRH
jgi:hypothetical protein